MAAASGDEVSVWCLGATRTMGPVGAIEHVRQMLTLDRAGRDWWLACLAVLGVRA